MRALPPPAAAILEQLLSAWTVQLEECRLSYQAFGKKFGVERSELWESVPKEIGLNPILSMENEI